MALNFEHYRTFRNHCRSISDLRLLLEDQSNEAIIFSGGRFQDYFSNLMENNSLLIHNINLEKNSIIFNEFKFGNCKLDLTNICLEAANIIFKNCVFDNCAIDFAGASIKSGNLEIHGNTCNKAKILFNNLHIGEGSIDINFSSAKESEINFSGESRLEKGQVHIQVSEAQNSRIDFSNFEHPKGDFEFTSSQIINSELNFERYTSNEGNFKLSQAEFRGQNAALKFSNSRFGKGDINLSNLTFQNSILEGKNCDYGSGAVTFENLTLERSTAEFDDSKMEDGEFNFENCEIKSKSKLSFIQSQFSGKKLNFENLGLYSSNVSFFEANIECKRIEFDGSTISNEDALKSTLSLEKANVSAEILSFASSHFNCAVLRLDDINVEARLISFDRMTFEDESLFDLSGAIFNCNHFSITSSNIGVSELLGGELKINADQIRFNQSTFVGKLLSFTDAQFKAKKIDFHDCRWSGTRVDFRAASFTSHGLNFERNNFESEFTYFDHAEFNVQKVKFDNSKFSGRATFADIMGVGTANEFSFRHCVFDNSFDLSSDATFGCVVDLTRTKMSNQFSIENVSCEINTVPNRWLGNKLVWPLKFILPKHATQRLRRFIFNRKWLSRHRIKDKKDIERLRRLKQIAGDNKSTRQALEYRVKETQAERWQTTKTDIVIEFVFWLLSDYGRREPRVVGWLGLSLLGFAGIYYQFSPAAIDCWDKFKSAVFYSLSNIIPFIPISRTSRMENAETLFGNGSPDFDLPNHIIAIASIQSLLSVLLLFLFGLAVRNRFKV